jgi:hypothetical protein
MPIAAREPVVFWHSLKLMECRLGCDDLNIFFKRSNDTFFRNATEPGR